MKIVRLEDVARLPIDLPDAKNVVKQVPISKLDGSPTLSCRVFTMGPGGHTPYHQHPSEHVNYVIAGHGALVTASGEERKLTKGDFALVLPNEKHQFRNRSAKRPFVIICAVPKEYE